MKQNAVLRVAGEICFFFSVLNVFSAFGAWRLPMAVFAAACLLLGFAIVRFKSAPVRLILSLVPALAFLMGPFELLVCVPALAIVYYALVMTRGAYALPLYEYRRNFTVMLVISLFFLAANVANATVYRGKLISVDSLIYAFAFLVLGVVAMRRMQMGTGISTAWQVRNALSVIGLPLLAVGLSLVLFLVLRFTQAGLLMVLMPVGRFAVWLIQKIFPSGGGPARDFSLPEAFNIERNANFEMELEVGSDAPAAAATQGGFNPLLIERAAAVGGWVILALLLALAVYLVVCHAQRGVKKEDEALACDGTEDAPPERRGKSGRRAPILGNARQLRRIYKTYLEYRRARGVAVLPADTSAEILARDGSLTGEAQGSAERLRELYIAARYGDPSAVTREQVQEAQACLEQIMC